MTPTEIDFCNDQIKIAESYFNQNEINVFNKFSYAYENTNDDDRFIYVHHDAPFINRNTTIPESEEEFESYLFKVSLDNPDLYEFLKEERVRQNRYK